jgi:hypothetical protein
MEDPLHHPGGRGQQKTRQPPYRSRVTSAPVARTASNSIGEEREEIWPRTGGAPDVQTNRKRLFLRNEEVVLVSRQ